MRMFILVFLLIVKSTLAANVSLHQQQIENITPNQAAVDLSTKKYDALMMQQMPDSIKAKRMQTDEAYQTSSSILHTGFIAQEVEEAAKKVGFNFDGVDAPKNENDLYGIRYAEFVVPLVKAVQEQQVTINAQQTTINAQQKQINELKLMVEALMKK